MEEQYAKFILTLNKIFRTKTEVDRKHFKLVRIELVQKFA